MNQVEAFILDQGGQQGKVMQYLHDLMLSFPEITCKIRYKIPFYYYKSWVCYLHPKKGDRVEFVFIRGQELSNEQGLLDTQGRKQVSGILLDRVEDIPVESLMEII